MSSTSIKKIKLIGNPDSAVSQQEVDALVKNLKHRALIQSDTAQLKSQHPEWLLKEMDANADLALEAAKMIEKLYNNLNVTVEFVRGLSGPDKQVYRPGELCTWVRGEDRYLVKIVDAEPANYTVQIIEGGDGLTKSASGLNASDLRKRVENGL